MENKKIKSKNEKVNAEVSCTDRDCHLHGNLRARGRNFEGTVIRKFNRRITIEFERMVYVKKYERYAKSKTKIHARVPDCMDKTIKVGDIVSVKECRPLSKIIHFVLVNKIKDGDEQTSGGSVK